MVQNSQECVLNASTQREPRIKQSKNKTKTKDTHKKLNNEENSEDSEQTKTGKINSVEPIFVLLVEVTLRSDNTFVVLSLNYCNTRLQHTTTT